MILRWRRSPGEGSTEAGDGRYVKSNALVKVFNVVGVAVASGLILRLLVDPLYVGARSEVMSDNFGRFPGDMGPRFRSFSEENIDSELAAESD